MTPRPAALVRNVLTFDVEDYYHVSAFDSTGKRARWDHFESRVCANTHRVLDLCAEASVRATFFVLGWVAERYPSLVRRIAEAGHEVASHGYGHRLIYDLSPEMFRADLRRSRCAIEAATGVAVRGYRAPSFSITKRSLWALDVLVEEGFDFDSSVFPVVRDRYGLPGAPRHAHARETAAGTILEIPPSTICLGGMTFPVAGGGYFRLYPFSWTRHAIRALNEREGMPAVVYLHPWEIDPQQPRQEGSALSRFRHSVNLGATESRLRRLLGEFAFGPIAEIVGTFPAVNRRHAGLPASVCTTPAAAGLAAARLS
jgi:polysaccharide deacetylase family protein (PEP-CTERM system associated)